MYIIGDCYYIGIDVVKCGEQVFVFGWEIVLYVQIEWDFEMGGVDEMLCEFIVMCCYLVQLVWYFGGEIGEIDLVYDYLIVQDVLWFVCLD